MTFTVDLPVKPYVKAHIDFTFGNPANFALDQEVNDYWRRCLVKRSIRWDYLYDDLSFKRYSATAKVLVSEDDFYRHGCDLTKTTIIAFGKYLERRQKFIMRIMVSSYMVTMIQRDAILKFQQTFGYSEDSWPFDSIKKDYNRADQAKKIDLSTEISEKLESIILDNLSLLGTIYHKQSKSHEHNKKTA